MEEQTKELCNFLVYDYFDHTYDELSSMYQDNPGKVIRCCAERAYLDFNRTLTYVSSLKKKGQGLTPKGKEKAKSFRERIYGKYDASVENSNCDVNMIWRIQMMLRSECQNKFDELHTELCSRICCYANTSDLLDSVFHYGQAQKWVNMTLKYMMLLGFWNELAEKEPSARRFLHVPIDSYILKIAASVQETESEGDNEYRLNVKAPRKSGPDGAYSADQTLPWSKWDRKHYIQFCKELDGGLEKWRKNDPRHAQASRIDWEGLAWIVQAQQESRKG